jgi:hypothetical protein
MAMSMKILSLLVLLSIQNPFTGIEIPIPSFVLNRCGVRALAGIAGRNIWAARSHGQTFLLQTVELLHL